ncbi:MULTISPECIES: cell division protein CrgA [Arthrobacter]|uniref:Cell division protein CrgA n=2 Tax=Arthrobacter TaxID=1663 RepID=A0ABU9KIW4_9MICC|nr:cell division protein CrgA [Arthrobacter sp. YJM1]MDP5226923.1 cell division protein CrgA [Arthrobacter sp. YJM1]
MPESKQRRRPKSQGSPKQEKAIKPTPGWYKILMFGLMIVGLLWIMTFYISNGVYPVPALQMWNIGIGFGLLLLGFLMTTRWRS